MFRDSVSKSTMGVPPVAPTLNLAPASTATSSTTPPPAVNMVRAHHRDLEPEPEPRRHPVATWRPQEGPTVQRHSVIVLPTAELWLPVRRHCAGRHTGDIVYGANQTSCWLRCTLCDCTSPRIRYQHVCCMRCATRRNSTQPTWATLAQCVWVSWGRLLLRFFWMGMEDARSYFADKIMACNQRRLFVDAMKEEEPEVFYEIHLQDPSNAQGPCPSKPFRGLEQCLPWHTRIRGLMSRGYSWISPVDSQRDYHIEGYSMGIVEHDEQEVLSEMHQQDPHNTQGSCLGKPGMGLEQRLSWHRSVWAHTVRGYSWLWAKLLQEEYPQRATP